MADLSGMIHLSGEEPTHMAIADLHEWVVWQFPRPRPGGLCAALHPPEPEFGWLPAIIDPETEMVAVYAHATAPFPSPEEAVDWMEEAKEGGAPPSLK